LARSRAACMPAMPPPTTTTEPITSSDIVSHLVIPLLTIKRIYPVVSRGIT
jgi:hypothetical protein